MRVLNFIFSFFLFGALVSTNQCDYCLDLETEKAEVVESHCHDTKAKSGEDDEKKEGPCCPLCVLTPTNEVVKIQLKHKAIVFELEQVAYQNHYQPLTFKPVLPPPKFLV